MPNAVLGNRKAGRFSTVMQQSRPTKDWLRRDILNHCDGMAPDILIVVRILLFKPKHGDKFWDRYCKHICIGPHYICRSLSAKHFAQLDQDALRSNAFEQLFIPVDGRCRSILNSHSIYRGKAKGSERSQAILPEPPVWIANAANKPFRNISFAPDKIYNTRLGVVCQSIHREIPPLHIILQVSGEGDRVRVPMIRILAINAISSDLQRLMVDHNGHGSVLQTGFNQMEV